jgi:hypothetical protein
MESDIKFTLKNLNDSEINIFTFDGNVSRVEKEMLFTLFDI